MIKVYGKLPDSDALDVEKAVAEGAAVDVVAVVGLTVAAATRCPSAALARRPPLTEFCIDQPSSAVPRRLV